MRPTTLLLVASSVFAVACTKERKPDAYGNFEADEVTVSAQTTGQLLTFTPTEGNRLERGTLVGVVDTMQLTLERRQILAQTRAVGARVNEVTDQIGVYEVQRDIAHRNLERTRRLYDQKAATAQQLDQAERDYTTLNAQITAAGSQQHSIRQDAASTEARVAQIADKIAKSRILNPEPGTVLATFAKAGEVVQPGQPLYKVANLDTLTLRAYVVESQLALVKIGQRVHVNVDQGGGKLETCEGVISWVASKAEFTPTPVQTRDERTGLVYAVKVRVPNPNGRLKIGMPADIVL
ncbi:MAG TPA: HlyD family efflux transporter periplasmic adaptor subunit [Gemmatimonadaceae bacterium]